MTILPFGAKQAVCSSSQGRFSIGTTTDSILHRRRWWRTVSLQNAKEKLVAMVIPLMRRRKELPDFQKRTASTRRSGTPQLPTATSGHLTIKMLIIMACSLKFHSHLKGTIRPGWISLRMVSLDRPQKGHPPLYVFDFLILILNNWEEFKILSCFLKKCL